MHRLVKRLNAVVAKDVLHRIILGLLIVNVALLTWYIFNGYQSSFHSDSAVKVLLAREIVETGEYFPSDWNYVNEDLFVLGGQTFIIPLLAIFPAGFFAQALSGLVSSALILLGAWLLTGLFEIGKLKRLVIITVLATGISGFMAENLYGQATYGTFFYFTCYIIYFAWAFLSFNGRRKILFGVGLFSVLLPAFWSNPQRAVVSYGLPLLLAVTYYIISSAIINTYSSREVRVGYQLIAVIFLSVVVGVVFHSITLLGVNNVLGASHARWLSYDEMMRNVKLTLKGFLAIFGGLPSAGGMLVSVSGVYEAIRLTSALALLVLMAPSIRISLQRKPGGGAQFVASFALAAMLLALFIQLTTTVPDMNDPVQSSRYLVLSLLLLLIVVLAQTHIFTKKPFLALVSATVSIVMITSAYPAFVRSNPDNGMDWGQPGQYYKHRQNLRDFMLTNGLRYGYATYWNAGVLSVLSDEKLLVRQIVIDRSLPMPMRHASSNRWYRPSVWQGETFLLLTTEEAASIKWDLLERYHAKPVRELNFEEFKIFVFAQNLANDLPGWDRRYEESASFLTSKESMSQVGKFHDNYENAGGALVAEKGEVGALHYGPYIDVEPGAYIVSFDVAVESAPNGSARLDVAAAPDQKLLAETVLIDNTSPRRLRFTLDKLATVEFRVWSLGNARVVFREVSIVRDDHSKISRGPSLRLHP
jgi:hypothetical protein